MDKERIANQYISATKSSQSINEDVQREHTNFKESIDKVIRLTDACRSDQISLLRRFNKNLEQIDTETQRKYFLQMRLLKFRNKNSIFLGVQTAILSRRKRGTCVSKRKQAGRPVKRKKGTVSKSSHFWQYAKCQET